MKMKLSPTAARRLAFATVAIAASIVQASDKVWTGISSNFYNTAANWNGLSVAGSSDRALFNNVASLRSTVAFESAVTVQAVVVSGTTPAGDYTFVSTGAGNGMNVTGDLGLNNSNGSAALTLDQSMGITAHTVTIGNGCGMGLANNSALNVGTLQLTTQGNATLGVRSNSVASAYFDHDSTGIMLVNAATMNAYGLEMRGGGNLEIQSGGVFNLNANGFGLAADGSVRLGQLRLLAGGTLNFVGAGRTLEISDSGSFTIANGYALPAGGFLRAVKGGDIIASSYFDIGNGKVGSLVVDGSGSTYSAQGLTDWGSNSGNATVAISNSGSASLVSLNVGAANGAAVVNVSGLGLLATSTALNAGGGATPRTVQVNVTGGSLTANGTATFDNQATLNLNTGSTTIFGQGASFLAGSALKWSGGSLTIASGKALNIGGGVATVTAGGTALGNNVTLNVTSAGTFTDDNYLDIGTAGGALAITGGLLVDGSGSTYTSGGTSDWGRYNGNVMTANITNSGLANPSALRLSINGGKSTVNIGTNGTLKVGAAFTAGGDPSSNVAVNLQSSGTLNFLNDATFTKGAVFNWSGGTLSMAAGKTLSFSNGALANLTLGGTAQPSGTTLSIFQAGSLTTTGYLDIHTGTLAIDGLNSSLTSNSSNLSVSDWAFNTGDVTTVNISNFGTAFYDHGLRISNNGGAATITLTSSGLLRAVQSPLTLGGAANASAIINVNGGVLSTTGAGANVSMGHGAVLNFNSGGVAFDGTLTMTDNAKIVGGTDATYRSINCGNLSMAPTSKIDLGNSLLNIAYTGGTPIDAIRALIKTGYANGAWTGNGITSSYCITNPMRSVAYTDDGNLLAVGIALIADTNFDQAVTFDDLLVLAQNYGQPGSKHWTDGDFTFDGVVNFNDLLILAQHYGQSGLTADQTGSVGSDFAADFALAQSLVPEPGALTAVITGGVVLLRRRRA